MISILLATTISLAQPDIANNPVIKRAIERRTMGRNITIAEQHIVGDQVITTSPAGVVTTSKVQRVVSARLTPSPRDLEQQAVASLARRLGADPADPYQVAATLTAHSSDLKELQTEAKKGAGEAGAWGTLTGIALGLGAGTLLNKAKKEVINE
jgi:hypothetical protein